MHENGGELGLGERHIFDFLCGYSASPFHHLHRMEIGHIALEGVLKCQGQNLVREVLPYDLPDTTCLQRHAPMSVFLYFT